MIISKTSIDLAESGTGSKSGISMNCIGFVLEKENKKCRFNGWFCVDWLCVNYSVGPMLVRKNQQGDCLFVAPLKWRLVTTCIPRNYSQETNYDLGGSSSLGSPFLESSQNQVRWYGCNTENRDLSWCQLCRYWWLRRLSWWQPPVPSMTTKLASRAVNVDKVGIMATPFFSENTWAEIQYVEVQVRRSSSISVVVWPQCQNRKSQWRHMSPNVSNFTGRSVVWVTECWSAQQRKQRPGLLSKIHGIQPVFSNMAFDWLAAVLSANQEPGLKICDDWNGSFDGNFTLIQAPLSLVLCMVWGDWRVDILSAQGASNRNRALVGYHRHERGLIRTLEATRS